MMRYGRAVAVLASMLLGACAPPSGPQRPALPAWQTDAAGCTWQWQEGGGLAFWTERCELSTGRWEVAWDPGSNAFVSLREGQILGIVVQPWPLVADEGLASVTAALVSAGQLAPEAACGWQPGSRRSLPASVRVWLLAPLAPEALAPTPQGEVPEPLCGAYGVSTHGVRYFITDPRWADLAIFVDEGQERPMFDPASLTLFQAGINGPPPQVSRSTARPSDR
jgi:hypothetical protein